MGVRQNRLSAAVTTANIPLLFIAIFLSFVQICVGAFGESGDTRRERIRYITGAKRLSFKLNAEDASLAACCGRFRSDGVHRGIGSGSGLGDAQNPAGRDTEDKR